jgi:hypothetical protein
MTFVVGEREIPPLPALVIVRTMPLASAPANAHILSRVAAYPLTCLAPSHRGAMRPLFLLESRPASGWLLVTGGNHPPAQPIGRHASSGVPGRLFASPCTRLERAIRHSPSLRDVACARPNDRSSGPKPGPKHGGQKASQNAIQRSTPCRRRKRVEAGERYCGSGKRERGRSVAREKT